MQVAADGDELLRRQKRLQLIQRQDGAIDRIGQRPLDQRQLLALRQNLGLPQAELVEVLGTVAGQTGCLSAQTETAARQFSDTGHAIKFDLPRVLAIVSGQREPASGHDLWIGRVEIDFLAGRVDCKPFPFRRRLRVGEQATVVGVHEQVRVRRVVPEQRRALPECMDLDALRAGIIRVPCALERPRQNDVRQLMGEIDFDPLDPAHVPKLAGGILFAIDAADDDAVAGGQLRGGACDIKFAKAGADPHWLRLLRGDRVPFDARGSRCDRLEGLRILVRVGERIVAQRCEGGAYATGIGIVVEKGCPRQRYVGASAPEATARAAAR